MKDSCRHENSVWVVSLGLGASLTFCLGAALTYLLGASRVYPDAISMLIFVVLVYAILLGLPRAIQKSGDPSSTPAGIRILLFVPIILSLIINCGMTPDYIVGWDAIWHYEPYANASNPPPLAAKMDFSSHSILASAFIYSFATDGLSINPYSVLLCLLLVSTGGYVLAKTKSTGLAITAQMMLGTTPLLLNHVVLWGYADFLLAACVANCFFTIFLVANSRGLTASLFLWLANGIVLLCAKETGWLYLFSFSAVLIFSKVYFSGREKLGRKLPLFLLLACFVFSLIPAFVLSSMTDVPDMNINFFGTGTATVATNFSSAVNEMYLASDSMGVTRLLGLAAAFFAIYQGKDLQLVQMGGFVIAHTIGFLLLCNYFSLFQSWALSGSFLDRMLLPLIAPSVLLSVLALNAVEGHKKSGRA